AFGEAARHALDAGGDDPGGGAQGRRGGHRLSADGFDGRGAAEGAGIQGGGAAPLGRLLARADRAVGSEVSLARPARAAGREPRPYDPARAKKLLAEAGYPNGFEGGDFYPFPPYNSMAEAIQGYLQAVGIRTQTRTMERATYFTQWREKKLRGVILVITATFGNAATRLEPYATRNGIYAYGSVPEIDDLYHRQGRELDPKKREAQLHQ